ncbi:hypothetical protein KBTX_03702 [wastewater metagenome]|uniref:Bro-N domain-containing protein n=3 Tax=root TaxID=1 RepID=A0A5B8RHA2_9ZZZZ|nr:hypothetical protein KBTEX_03702 [uncultured organism]
MCRALGMSTGRYGAYRWTRALKPDQRKTIKLADGNSRGNPNKTTVSESGPDNLIERTFNGHTIRVVTIDGEPWFVAADVCRVLGLTNPAVAIRPLRMDEKAHLRRGEPALFPRNTLNPIYGVPEELFSKHASRINAVSESGLYKLIMRSDKPDARAFQDWVTREVLPAIRKDGGYIEGEEKVHRRSAADFPINGASPSKGDGGQSTRWHKEDANGRPLACVVNVCGKRMWFGLGRQPELL